MSETTRRRLAIALLLALPLGLLARALVPGRVLLPIHPAKFLPLRNHADPVFLEKASRHENGDVVDKVLPILTDARAFAAGVREGRVPLWDPKNAGGAPLLGQAIAGSLYPPNLAELLLGPENAFAPLAVLALFLAGLFTHLFLRARGLPRAPSVFGAIVFAFSGYSLANLHYPCKVDAALWLPAALLAIERLVRRPGPLPAAGLAASIGMSGLAGFPQVTAYVALVAAAYALARIARLPEGRRAASILALAGATAGVLLASVALLPAAEASAQSLRVLQDAGRVRAGALETPVLLHFLLPHFFATPTEGPVPELAPLSWLLLDRPIPPLNFTESAIYLGVPGLLLALVGATRPGALFPSIGFILSILFAFGSHLVGPLFLTPLARVGAPSRALAVGAFFGAWLAALGAQAVLRPSARMFREGVAVGALLLGLLAVAAGASFRPDRLPEWAVPRLIDRWQGTPEAARVEPLDAAKVRALFPPDAWLKAGTRVRNDLFRLAAFAGATGAALFLARRRRLGSYLLGGVLVADLASLGFPLLAPRPRGELFPESPAVQGTRNAAGTLRVARFHEGPDAGPVLDLFRSNLPSAYGIADLSGHMAFAPRRPIELFEAIDPDTRFRDWFARLTSRAQLDHPILDLAGVGAILSAAPLDHPSLVPVFREPGFHSYRRREAPPRAWVVPRARLVRDDGKPGAGNEAIAAIVAGEIRPFEEVLLPDTAPAIGGEGGGEVEWLDDSPERIEVAVRNTGGGWLVTSEVFFPGWEATLDGLPVPIERANYAWRAVALPAGAERRVVFRYRPLSFRIGVAASALAALALLAAVAAGTRARRRALRPA